MKALTLSLLAALAAASAAAQAPPDDATRQRIREAVQRATGVVPESIEASKLMPGYFEIRAKGAVAYVDAGARRLVKGPVIDLATGENLSQNGASGVAPRVDTASLPLADAVTTVAGKGERKLFVFVDPNCNFCRSLEPELAQLTNVSVHRFLVPVLGPGSQAVSRNVWCAADRAAAWRAATTAQAVAAAPERCDAAALDRNLALAKRLGVTATPTLVFANGERVAAVMSTQDIESRLSGPVVALKH